MSVVFVYTLNDYFESPILINVDTIALNESNVFPAVSVCIHNHKQKTATAIEAESFVATYYAEHNIEWRQE